MPKMKSNSGAKKRFKRTASGKFKRGQVGHRHLNTGKPKTRKRNLAKNTLVDATQQHQIEAMLPYR